MRRMKPKMKWLAEERKKKTEKRKQTGGAGAENIYIGIWHVADSYLLRRDNVYIAPDV